MNSFWQKLTLASVTLLGLSACAPTMTPRPPAIIERLDTETVAFTGSIETGDAERFEALLTPETRRLIVSSGGGEVIAGLKIGKLIHQHGLDVEVKEYCGSACANYIFTAGKRKIIPKGAYVGFHGAPENSPVIRFFNFLHQNDPKYRVYREESDRLSNEFYALIGINPKLYAHSAQFTLANNVVFWVPSPRELECMNVSGLDMWFSESPADLIHPSRTRVRTTAQDVRQPAPDICKS